MMISSERSRKGYDRLAGIYQALEFVMFRWHLQFARTALLDDLPDVQKALILGDGDGRFLEHFCRVQPSCDVTSVEQSGRMLEAQRRRLAKLKSPHETQFIQCDARSLIQEKYAFDLLVCNFFLDCFTEPELREWMPLWLDAVRPGGLFYFVDFHRPASGWRRFRADCYLGLMHRLFRWQTGLPNRGLVPLEELLSGLNLRLVIQKNMNHGLIQAKLYRVIEATEQNA